jgi:hypothetical protein
VDFAPAGGVYAKATRYLVDGELREWTGTRTDALSPVCVRRGTALERKPIGPEARLHYRCIQNSYQNSQIIYEMFSPARFWVLGIYIYILSEVEAGLIQEAF